MRQPVYFISHGSGPWPWMAEAREAYASLAASLSAILADPAARPDAILMVSAHWVTHGGLRVGSHPHPGMVHDYYGFPPHTYEIRYPAPGDPALAGRVLGLLATRGIPAKADPERGYDHGAFVPAYLMAPDAGVPMVQLSIEAGFDPAWHIAVGRALAPLRDGKVLIIGSGLSYHNLRRLGPDGAEPSARFDAWLQSALAEGPAGQREAALCVWEQAPAARIAHPREDHLIPLHVALGAADGDAAACFHHETGAFGGITVSSFRFG